MVDDVLELSSRVEDSTLDILVIPYFVIDYREGRRSRMRMKTTPSFCA